MARDDIAGVFSSLSELRPSTRVAAPVTLNMAGLADDAPKKRRKTSMKTQGRPRSDNVEDRRSPFGSRAVDMGYSGEDRASDFLNDSLTNPVPEMERERDYIPAHLDNMLMLTPKPGEATPMTLSGLEPPNAMQVAENVSEGYLLKRLEKLRDLHRIETGPRKLRLEQQIDHTMRQYEDLYRTNREDFG